MTHALDYIRAHFREGPRSGIVHVGASSGQEVEDYKAAGTRPVVLIEPLPGPYAQLVETIAGEPGFYPLQACCDAVGNRDVDFHVASNDGMSSSYLRPSGHLAAAASVTFDETVRVTTTTLDALLADLRRQHDLPAAFPDYLTLDTQGAEKEVLLGARETLRTVNYIWLEVSFGGLYEGDTGLYEMIDFLRGQGFDIYNLVMMRSWGDALFIRSGLFPPLGR
ncbi:MAG: FkbM family methyltransferase [Bauldia sp.]|uniref:FkbM family methyltransferase n=1 Tax=Bauldia sp. TaxID=2575872 RepID=UPI001D3E88AA|nr:FkbM family methyltransferase [Bauldia sp.]MCB1496479.1 FkbM family methyltransferase [Bauldia sp.]